MSTLKTVNIQHPSSSTPSALTTSTGDLTNAAGISYMGGNKNLLYNGAMQIHQRSASVAGITTGGYYTADRYQIVNLTQGTWTNDIQNDAPAGSGLRKSFRMLCTTADATPAAADMIGIDQVLEGQDLQRIAKGTSSAQQLTLSFWVKSNVTGTYIVSLYDNDSSPARQVCGSYTIVASATWEKKTITFPADTIGAFDNDNAASLYIRWYLGAGSNRTSGTLATSWASFNQANDAVGQTNLAASTNNYWQITGVQLEIGPVATSFEFKSYGNELRECQRYFERLISTGNTPFDRTSAMCSSTSSAIIRVDSIITKRTTPSVAAGSSTSAASTFSVVNSGGNLVAVTGISIINFGPSSLILQATGASSLVAGGGTLLYSIAGQTGIIDIGAEL